MPHAYSGVLTEVGGPEIGSTGNEKPRKVIVKADVAKQYGKVFRIWASDSIWDEVVALNGKPVTVQFEIEERQGPKGAYQQNLIVGIESNNGEGGEGDWGPPTDPGVGGSTPGPVESQSPSPSSRDDYWERREQTDQERSRQMAAAWSVSQAISILSVGKTEPPSEDEVYTAAHRLLILKERIASESK